MKIFVQNEKMINLILANHNLLPVIHRFGIRLGFRNKTVQQLCNQYNINTDFFLLIVNTFHNPKYFPEEKLLEYSPLLIIDYLKKTHNYYRNYSLPRIEKLFQELQKSSRHPNNEMQITEEFFRNYKQKVLEHIADEEQKVFPYITTLIEHPDQLRKKKIQLSFEDEHKSVDLEIDDLKTLIIKYINPDYDELICNALLIEISRFEKDILDHSRIEDTILIPQVNRLQKQI
ncbi:MAG TPA: hemerythrin domain-containing protein [Draconibacterium sp.]|nr:hemerythrin domain-containing protein [Draconibacterium sp.]